MNIQPTGLSVDRPAITVVSLEAADDELLHWLTCTPTERYYGYPLATNDVDAWVAANPSNAGRLVEALNVLGFACSGLAAELFL
jgi:hypothetical protein